MQKFYKYHLARKDMARKRFVEAKAVVKPSVHNDLELEQTEFDEELFDGLESMKD